MTGFVIVAYYKLAEIIDQKPIVGFIMSFLSSIFAVLQKLGLVFQCAGIIIGLGIGVVTLLRAIVNYKRDLIKLRNAKMLQDE